MSGDERILLAGTRIGGRFTIDGVLGQGGMGVVYRGRQELLDREVAIKVMHRGLGEDATLVERFLTEAKSAAALRHPNVVGVIDLGRDEAAGVFLVLELLEGESLAARLARTGPLSPAEARALLEPVMDALDAAHARGIVHRDVKPENVFLARDHAGAITPKLLDFGIARLIAPGSEKLTATGMIVGTPAYMSPEQCRGRDVGPAADVWAMGCVLHECLAGRIPFDGSTPTDLIVAICTESPRPLPDAVPAAVRAVVDRALSRDPGERWPSMRAMIDALRAAGAPAREAPADPITGEGALAPTLAVGAVATPERARGSGARGIPDTRALEPAGPSGTTAARAGAGPALYAGAAAVVIALLAAALVWSSGGGDGEARDAEPITRAPDDGGAPREARWPDRATRWWRGSWTKPTSPSSYQFVLHLRREEDDVEGVFEWTHAATGATGLEWVSGRYDSATHHLDLTGERASGSVVTDVYRFELAEDGMLRGQSRTAEGDWGGTLSALPQGRAAPPAPYDVAAPPEGTSIDANGVASRTLSVPRAAGATPRGESTVRIEQSSWSSDGTLLDSTFRREGPDEIALASLPPGLALGIRHMTVGERRRFWVPAALAGGDAPRVIDVELVSIVE